MGKIRVAALGDEQSEKEQKKKAETRREAKKAKKAVNESLEQVAGENPVVATTDGTDDKKKKTEEQKTEGKAPKVKSKKYVKAAAVVEKNKLYSLPEGIELVKKTSYTKFDGTVEIHVNLNAEVLNGKNEFRGMVNLPHGSGKQVKVAIVDDAVLKKLEAGVIDFDVLIS